MTAKPPEDPHSPFAAGAERVRCYVCETDLTEEPDSNTKKKNKKKVTVDEDGKEKPSSRDKGAPRRGLVELRSEGTGFAGGGKNMAKREGVAFQC